MKKELDKTKASFKLDLIETANVDPTVRPADLKVLAAYIAVMAWPSCKSWLAVARAMAMTGLSHGQFWTSRARLLGDNEEKRAYLIAVRQGGKVATYKLINPWRDEARERVDAMLDYHREVARTKKAKERASKAEKERDLSLQNLEGQIGGCPSRIPSSVPPDTSTYTPIETPPRKKERREENPHGSNVVSIDTKRRIA